MTLDSRHWSTTDGHLHTSVPTTVPVDWKPRAADAGLTYVSGAYTIARTRYASTRYASTGYTYTVFRDGVELSLGFYSRLRDAKERAVSNAEGRDVVNVA